MEDAAICEMTMGDGNSLFAVFDGHGGSEVSQYVSSIFKDELMKNNSYRLGRYENAMIEVFEKIDVILRSDEGEKALKDLRSKKQHKTNKRSDKVGD
jgi:protein phosphatase 1G